MERRLRGWLPVLVVVLALSLAGLGAAGGGLTGREIPPPPPLPPPEQTAPEETATPPPEAIPTATPREPPEGLLYDLLAWLFVLVPLAIGAVLVGYLTVWGVRWLFTERVLRRAVSDQAATQPGEAAAELGEVRDALRAGLADIDAGGDPRRAIIACWLRLERVAAAAGTARLVADTPGDLVARLLSRHRVSRRALDRLAEAYRRARYAPGDVDESLLRLARQALQEVDGKLGEVAVDGQEMLR